MEFFRFTLFNSLTLFVMAATLGMVAVRAMAAPAARWPAGYWVLVAAFALAFQYSLNLYLVAVGLLAAVLVRFMSRPMIARVLEFAVMGYVFTRCLGLLLLW
jgi:hypothetical protein